MNKNSFKFLLGAVALAAATSIAAPESAQAQAANAHGWSSSHAVPGFSTTISSVCEEAKKNARLKATLACAPKDAKVFGCAVQSSGAGPAFPPPLFYYWCKVTCAYTCVDKAADATAQNTSSPSTLEKQLIEHFQRTQANSELESLFYEAGEAGELDIDAEELK
ncbi:MAG: hypothetical protein KDD66_17635 [Bdellovibrionales bacterium]|nr:hypothetical protein [Bdellovibrionales bacterium]